MGNPEGQSVETFIQEATTIWHEKNKGRTPKNLQARLAQAERLCSYPLDDEQRAVLARQIGNEVYRHFQNLLEHDSPTHKKFLEIIKEFEKGEISLSDMNNFANSVFESSILEGSLQPGDNLAQTLIDIKHAIYQALKGDLKFELSDDAKSQPDKVFDDSRRREAFEKDVRKGLLEANELLSETTNYRGTKVTCIDLNPYNDEDIVISEGETMQDIDYDNLEWEDHHHIPKKPNKDIVYKYAIVESEDSEQTSVIFKLQFKEQDLGHIEYCFEGNGIDPIVLRRCASITGEIDSFVDTRLQQKLEKDIEAKRRIILRNSNLTEWRDMCTDTCQMLNKILGRPVRFECKRFDIDSEEMWSAEVDDEQITTNPKDEASSKAKKIPLTIKDNGEETHIGFLSVECHNSAEERIIEKFKVPLEQILQRREEKRHTFIKAAGLNVANAYLDGNMELLRRLKVGVLYADIVGFSKITKELHEAALREEIDEDTVAKIIDEFVTEVATLLERKYGIVIDKFVGDELIAIFGALRPSGEKLDVCKCLETLDKVGDDMQENLCRIATDVAERVRIKFGITGPYPRPEELQFSYSLGLTKDLVGMLGNPESKYSRLDFTVIGDDMNALARVLNAAGAGEKLMTKKSWDEYEAAGGQGLVKVGEPFLIEGKNIGLIEVVLIEKQEVQEARLAKQRALIDGIEERYQKHIAAGGRNKPLFNPENLHEFPEGIYQIELDKKPKLGRYIAKVVYSEGGVSEGIIIEIPSVQLEPIEVYVNPEDYKKLEEENKETLLIKRGEKFTLVRYRSIENKIAERIEDLYRKNKFLGRNKTEASPKDLMPGEWELVKYWEDGDAIIFQLDRSDKKVHLVMRKEDKAIKRMPIEEDRTLIFKDGQVDFKEEYPNWYEEFKVRD